jgi:hypothetical protein
VVNAGQASRTQRLRGTFAVLLVAGGALSLSGVAQAATTTFGSPLAVQATADTAKNLAYSGSDIPTIDPGPPPRAVVVHINHDGADTALWPQAIPGGSPTAPAAGQVTAVRLEGCAQPASGGPPPNTQIHFQDLVPQAGGSFRVNVTTQPFDVPVCGQPTASGTASGNTITTYQPTNFCVQTGDAVDFNDEGGFDSHYYPSGVPFQVLGSVSGASTLSFIRNGGTNNGAVFSPSDMSTHDGFAANPGYELMLQATLATGPDATPLCPGGTSGIKPPAPAAPPAPKPGEPGGPPALVLRRQTDGVNHSRWVGLAVYCARLASPCTGTVSVISAGTGAAKAATLGTTKLTAAAHHTVHVRMRLTKSALLMIRHHGRRLPATLVVRQPDGTSFSQAITLKI